MNENHQKLTQARLKELLEYNLHTGDFIWRADRGRNAKSGGAAGSPDKAGYIRIKIDRKLYAAHRLAFLYVLGRWPENDVDHTNEVKSDNSWINLRPATRSQNQHNRKANSNNEGGMKNVSWNERDQYWCVQVGGNGERHQSYHKCKLDAVATAYRLRRELHGTFANHG